jgi:predicted O-linked N-acetylglucosamine transferase (SPINDLY family)
LTHIPDDTFERAKKHFLSGLQHVLHENWSDAEREFRISLTHHPNRISTLVNLSAVLIRLGRLGEAHALLERGYLVDPLNRELLLNHGLLLFEERQYERAIAFYDRLLEREPSCAEAWLNRGVCLGALGLPEAAIASYDRSIEINPNYAEAWSNRGVAFNDLGLQAEALVSYARAAELKPDASGALGALVHARMKICDWVDFDRHRETIEKKITIGDLVVYPFAFLGLCEEPSLQRQCAELFSKQKYGSISQFGQVTNRGNSRKIRVGYFSMDFREHPVAHLIAELIEMHDRKRFEIWGFSFGFNTGDTMRKRLERAFDRFFDVRSLNDLKIAQLARENAIDIAVDLGGYTQGSRPAIFVHRAAPIQINYLGFPGTMGAPVMDYLVADPIVIPTDFQSNFSEKIIYLPDSYQVNDSKRLVSNRPITREEFGLPKSSFVFCCFSSSWKILPATFAAWARILRSTPNTTLWLYEDN